MHLEPHPPPIVDPHRERTWPLRRCGVQVSLSISPNPKSHKSSLRSKPNHISQVDDPDSDHVDHDDHDEQDDDKHSDGDPRVDFTALAVSYNTIDI